MAAPDTKARTPERTRATPRLKVFQPATIEADGRELRVHLLDISRAGALGHADEPPMGRPPVVLACNGWSATGRIMWVEGRRFGIRFDLPLADEWLARLLAVRA